MLSRVADALFWMSRNVERAEHVARLLDVWFHLELDLSGAGAAPFELHWTALAAILQQQVPPRGNGNGPSPQGAISQWLTFEADNAGSIMSCLAKARLNARSIRGTFNSEIWRELNKLYWKLCDPEFVRRAKESPYELYQTVECGSALFQGLCDTASAHDEGWQFLQLGKFVERADKTLRILDIQYHLLREMGSPADGPLHNLHWAAVLKSCRGYEAYQRRYVGRVDPDRVVEFLLFEPTFPRSVRFSLEALVKALDAIEGPAAGRVLGKPDRLLGLMLAELRYRSLESVLDGDLHEFLTRLIDQVGQVSRAVQERFSLR